MPVYATGFPYEGAADHANSTLRSPPTRSALERLRAERGPSRRHAGKFGLIVTINGEYGFTCRLRDGAGAPSGGVVYASLFTTA